MKNKAFTLIELLGVIVLLGIIVLVAFPPLLNQINKSKQGISEATKEIIIDAAKDYYENNKKEYKKIDGVSYCINVDALVQQNYLNEKIKDKDLNDIKTDNFVKLTYQNEKYKYEIVDECTKYTVTFDPNGGIVNKDTKEVIKGSKYGELPTPTREGYTFMGWNGKNMLNLKERTVKEPGGEFDNTSIRTFSDDGIYKGLSANNYYINTNILNDYKIDTTNNNVTVTSLNDGYGIAFNIKVLPNIQYTVNSLNQSNATVAIGLYKEDGTYIKTVSSKTILTTEETFWLTLVVRSDTNKQQTAYNIQLEEGDEATPYEPFYIEEDTNVVQEQDHTLKAIWKANE